MQGDSFKNDWGDSVVLLYLNEKFIDINLIF